MLESLQQKGGVARSVDIANSLGLPAPTVHRFLATLAARGYLTQLADKRYSLGPSLVRLGVEASKQSGHLVQPILDRLAEQLGETVNLAFYSNDTMTYVAQATSSRSMRMFTQVGARVSVFSSGVGKAALAEMPEQEVVALATASPAAPPLRTLVPQLDECRHRGYALDDEEQEEGVRCIAVAVPGGPAPAGLSVSSPMSRLTPDVYDDVADTLKSAAGELTHAWRNAHVLR